MVAAFLLVALFAYIVGVFVAGFGPIYRSPAARTVASVVLVGAWVAHLAAVVSRVGITGRIPLTNAAEYLLSLGLAVMTLHLVVWFRWRVDAAALVLPPVSAMAVFGALVLFKAAPTTADPGPPGWFLFHVTVSTLGMAMLVVALAMSLIYVVQDRGLKSHRTLRWLERLPSLERCDYIGVRALLVGFTLLTMSIVTGIVVNTTRHHQFWTPGAKQVFPVLAWIVLVLVLVARYGFGFRGRKSAYLTITAVALGLLTVVGMTI